MNPSLIANRALRKVTELEAKATRATDAALAA